MNQITTRTKQVARFKILRNINPAYLGGYEQRDIKPYTDKISDLVLNPASDFDLYYRWLYADNAVDEILNVYSRVLFA